MKKFQLKAGLIFASWAVMLMFGCPKKKPPIPPQEQAPTISTVEQQPQPEPQVQNPQPQNPQPAQEPEQATNKPPDKPAPPKHPKPRPIKRPPADADKSAVEIAKNNNPPEPPEPPRVVIQEGSSAQSGQNGTGAAGNDQATTQQLLDSAEANLRSIKRQLSAKEQSTAALIRDYINQSKKATKDGDQVGAYKLAVKAHLLSDDLAKPQ